MGSLILLTSAARQNKVINQINIQLCCSCKRLIHRAATYSNSRGLRLLGLKSKIIIILVLQASYTQIAIRKGPVLSYCCNLIFFEMLMNKRWEPQSSWNQTTTRFDECVWARQQWEKGEDQWGSAAAAMHEFISPPRSAWPLLFIIITLSLLAQNVSVCSRTCYERIQSIALIISLHRV